MERNAVKAAIMTAFIAVFCGMEGYRRERSLYSRIEKETLDFS